LDDFHNFYWYLNELVTFCRQHGLSTAGQKQDIVARIESFLKTGKAAKAPKARKPTERRGPITKRTRVTEAFKSDDETREFFKSVIGPHFHFTAQMQQWRKDKQRAGVPITYGDLVREWLDEKERRKDKKYRSPLQRTWEYNRFVRDFLADKSRNEGEGIAGAARAWNEIRVHNGPRSYTEYMRIRGTAGKGPSRRHTA
jgi:hypothetical protein